MKWLGPVCALTLTTSFGLWALLGPKFSEIEARIVYPIASFGFVASLVWLIYVALTPVAVMGGQSADKDGDASEISREQQDSDYISPGLGGPSGSRSDYYD